MEPFVTHRGKVAVLDWSDVNTDLIIPARYLKRIERTGYGPLLFADKRYAPGGAPPVDDPDKPGAPAPDFPLNAPANQGATVLVVGRNFGCGSSREHAVWAVAQGGYRAVIAPGKGEGFADIFEGNAFNNGLLPIELDEADWKPIAEAGRAAGGAEVSIDLRAQTVTLHPANGADKTFRFDVSEADRHRLLNGLDAIAETLLDEPAIRTHEERTPSWMTPQSV
ncbi:MAG: 3-isopropylmalate dehydratase small subunit [Isosphaeraceae bacterium]|nr:3-isopropylmalate dehydratase small subunit [Isosphaeraceae bacterium]